MLVPLLHNDRAFSCYFYHKFQVIKSGEITLNSKLKQPFQALDQGVNNLKTILGTITYTIPGNRPGYKQLTPFLALDQDVNNLKAITDTRPGCKQLTQFLALDKGVNNLKTNPGTRPGCKQLTSFLALD